MKNLFRTCLLVAGVAPLLVVASPSVQANDGVCTVVGAMTLSTEFGDFTSRTADFQVTATVGACAPTFSTPQMAGTVTGTCVNAAGTGTTNSGHTFAFTWAAKIIVFTGGVTGAFGFDGNSCADETARRFTVGGAVTM